MFDYEPLVAGGICVALAGFVGYCIGSTIFGWLA